MGKETKVGLFVIMLLLLLFGVVVVQKVRSSPSAEASQGAPDESERAGSDANSADSDGSLVAVSQEPTILEPDAFTQGAHSGVSPVYSDGSHSVDMEIPRAVDIGLASESSPPDQLMPNPAASLGQDAYDLSHGPSFEGETEPTKFEEPGTLDHFAGDNPKPEPYRQPPLAAIGVENQEPLVEEEDDPFGMIEEASPEEFADGTAPSDFSAPDDFGSETKQSWDGEALTGLEYEDADVASNANGDDAGGTSAAPRFDAMPSVDEEYSNGSSFASRNGEFEDGGGSLLMPDVPPAIEDFDSPSNRAPLRTGGSTYLVQSNDSFWAISQKQYGTGRYFKALHLHNQKTVPEPEKLRPGMTIATPPASVLDAVYSESVSKPASAVPGKAVGPYREMNGKKWYRVGNRDTLFDIAKSTLGQGSEWRVIYELNRDRIEDPDRLEPGMVLRLPDTADVNQMATTPLVPLR